MFGERHVSVGHVLIGVQVLVELEPDASLDLFLLTLVRAGAEAHVDVDAQLADVHQALHALDALGVVAVANARAAQRLDQRTQLFISQVKQQ